MTSELTHNYVHAFVNDLSTHMVTYHSMNCIPILFNIMIILKLLHNQMIDLLNAKKAYQILQLHKKLIYLNILVSYTELPLLLKPSPKIVKSTRRK